MRICCLRLKNKSTCQNNRDYISRFFYVLRGVAILSVAYAHSISLENVALQRIGMLLGLLGVPLFLLSSGFFFNPTSFTKLVKNTSINIIVPWIIWGTFAYSLSVYLGSVISLKSYLAYILGNGTWLYFVPVLIILRIVFYFFNSDVCMICFIATSLLFSVLPPPRQIKGGRLGTPFQIPGEWCG